MRVLIFVVMLALCGCASEDRYTETIAYEGETAVLGFMTVDKSGISARPFSTEPDMMVMWPEGLTPRWTALPLWFVGQVDDEKTSITVREFRSYYHESGRDVMEDVYYSIVEGGHQEKFESTWIQVYESLNSGYSEPIDITPIYDMIQLVYGKDEYRDLRDILTDCLMLIEDINKGDVGEENNKEAELLYNRFYSWLREFSTDVLKKEW